MDPPALLPPSGLWAPAGLLSGCIRTFFWRDFAQLPPEMTRETRVPATPYPGLSWVVRGQTCLVELGGQRLTSQPMPAVAMSGAMRQPFQSVAQGDGSFFCLVFQPGALALLLGLDMEMLTDRVVDARNHLQSHAVQAGPWLEWIEAVQAAPDHATRLVLCQSFLQPQWELVCQSHAPWLQLQTQRWQRPARARLARELDWTPRHLQRRVRQMTGLRAGEVERMLRAEDALLALRDGAASVVDAALMTGYADQAHLSRETRAVYEHPPAALKALVSQERPDPYWLMRR